ncbi:MAG: hypothetical protein UY95_C0020G0001 [Parcubacteria group bacterium GW2011_GWA2_56_7]|nr:MAG: hypothetical protein UY95_C0020G0001 [Parcubacteria group bacterium GW2011_GWA2_56_7]
MKWKSAWASRFSGKNTSVGCGKRSGWIGSRAGETFFDGHPCVFSPVDPHPFSLSAHTLFHLLSMPNIVPTVLVCVDPLF